MQFLVSLINYVFDIYIFILLLRVILQACHASWANPLVPFLVAVTKPLVNPVRKVIPGFKGIDLSIVVVAFALEVIEFYLTIWLSHSFAPEVAGVLCYSLLALVNKTLYIFWFAILIWTILSWIVTKQQNPLSEITGTISYPLVRSVRRFVPLIGGVDLSPFVVVVVLYAILSFAVAPLMRYCIEWAMP